MRCLWPLLALTLAVAAGRPARAEPAPVAPKPAAPARLLADGPEAVVVGFGKKDKGEVKEHEGMLCFLRTNRVSYRLGKDGNRLTYDAREGYIQWIRTADKKFRWDYDPKTGAFIGPVKPIEPIDISPLPEAGRNEAAMLFNLVEQLYRDLLAEVIGQQRALLHNRKPNEDTLRRHQRAAREYAEHARAHRLDPDLVGLCDGVDLLAEHWRTKCLPAFREIVARRQAKQKELERISRRYRLRLDEDRVIRTFRPRRFGEDDVIRTFVQSSLLVRSRTALLDDVVAEVSDQLDEEQRRELTDAVRPWTEPFEEQQQHLDKIGTDKYGRPGKEEADNRQRLLAALREKKDHEGETRYFAQLEREQPLNPFHQLGYCLAVAEIPAPTRAEQSAKLLQLARKCTQAIRLVPPGPIYDRSRRHVLFCACLLACAAADAELAGKGWGSAYSPAASHAVRLIDKYNESPTLFETSGVLREKRAWALAQCGRLDEALEQALQVRDLRKDSAVFAYNLARLYSLHNDANESLKWLESAIKSAGFIGIRDMRRNPDLAMVRAQKKKAFRDLTDFVSAYIVPPRQRQDLLLTNKSSYAWTNVRVKVRVLTRDGKTTTLTTKGFFPRLDPQSTGVLNNIFQGILLSRIEAVIVECDQAPTRLGR